jgi:hypothetical protein
VHPNPSETPTTANRSESVESITEQRPILDARVAAGRTNTPIYAIIGAFLAAEILGSTKSYHRTVENGLHGVQICSDMHCAGDVPQCNQHYAQDRVHLHADISA